jgi:hypothetical protein
MEVMDGEYQVSVILAATKLRAVFDDVGQQVVGADSPV